MTHLPLTRPLAGILDACRDAGRPLSQRDLGERRHPPVTQPTVANALSSGDGIALANLAAYARAAGLRLWVGASFADRPRRYHQDRIDRAEREGRGLCEVDCHECGAMADRGPCVDEEWAEPSRLWDVTADAKAAGVGVGPLRDALAGLGLEMVLTVEEASSEG